MSSVASSVITSITSSTVITPSMRAVDVGDRDREQVVARDELRDLLLVRVGRGARDISRIVSSRTGRVGRAVTSRRIGTTPVRRSSRRRRRGRGSTSARSSRARAQRVDRLLRGHLLVERREVGRHHAAGAVRRVELALRSSSRRAGGRCCVHDSRRILGHRVDQLEHVVDLEPRRGPRRVAGRRWPRGSAATAPAAARAASSPRGAA